VWAGIRMNRGRVAKPVRNADNTACGHDGRAPGWRRPATRFSLPRKLRYQAADHVLRWRCRHEKKLAVKPIAMSSSRPVMTRFEQLLAALVLDPQEQQRHHSRWITPPTSSGRWNRRL